jgi:hypothetical protein
MALKSSFGWMGAFSIGTAIFLAGCAGTAHVQKDNSANFSQYKTYSWVEREKPKNVKANHNNDIAEQNIRNSVNEQLQKKGYVESKDNPDVLISTDLLLERNRKEKRDPVYSDPFTRSYYNPRTRRVSSFYYPSELVGYDNYSTLVKEGTITVTMIDTKTDKAVWQGWATKQLNRSNITDKEIDQNVKSIFKKFDGK